MMWEKRSSCLGWTELGAAEDGALASAMVRASGVAWPWLALVVAVAITEEGVGGP